MSGLSFRPRPIDIFKKLPIIRVDIPNDEIPIPKPAPQPVQPEKPRSEIPVPKFVNVEYYDRLRAHINFVRGPSYYRCPVDRADKRDDKVDYDLDSDDEKFLESLNEGKKLLEEDRFERMIDKLEKLSGALGYDKMIDEKPFRQAFPHARELVLARVYEHWKQKREKRGGKALDRRFQAPPSADDTRPDVAFRPREIKARPIQKKQKERKNDLPSLQRLKHLRHNLERARTLLELVRQREKKKREITALVVEQRRIELKRNILTPIAPPKRPRVVMRSSPYADDFGSGVVDSVSQQSSERYDTYSRKRSRKHSATPFGPSLYKYIGGGLSPSQSPAPPLDAATSMASDTESESDISDHRPTSARSGSDRPSGPQAPLLSTCTSAGAVGLSPASSLPVGSITSAPPSLPFTHPKDCWMEIANMPQSFGRVSHIRCRIGRGGRRIIDRRCIWRTSSPYLEPELVPDAPNAPVATWKASQPSPPTPAPSDPPLNLETSQQPHLPEPAHPTAHMAPSTPSVDSLATEPLGPPPDAPSPSRLRPAPPPHPRTAVISGLSDLSHRRPDGVCSSSPPPQQAEMPASVPSSSSGEGIRMAGATSRQDDQRLRSHTDISRQSVSASDKPPSPRRYVNGVKLYSHSSTPHQSTPGAGALPPSAPLPLPAKPIPASSPPSTTCQLSPVTNRCNWDGSHPPSCTPPFRESTPLV